MRLPSHTGAYLAIDQDTGLIDRDKTAALLVRAFPTLEIVGAHLPTCIEATMDTAAKMDPHSRGDLDYQYLFKLARALKARLPPSCRQSLQGHSTARVLAPLAVLFQEAIELFDVVPIGGRVDWNDADQVMADFVATYRKVRYAKDEDPLTDAHAAALQSPHLFPIANRYERLLAGIAHHLQLAHPEEPIFLPRKRIAELLGVSPRLVSYLVEDGYLTLESDDYSFTTGVAKSYRFLGITSTRQPDNQDHQEIQD
ncbi:MAG: hypothetical protein QOJ65_2347 [Fimbriimonadaceae bacterium]|nr:hypothetical protein [Fimbriimonadaceae bacterium]